MLLLRAIKVNDSRMSGVLARSGIWGRVSENRTESNEKINVLLRFADRSRQESKIDMEIAPIPGIRALQAVKAARADFRPPEIFDIEGSARPGDGERQRQGRKAAGAEEEEDDLLLDAKNESDGQSSIDYFA